MYGSGDTELQCSNIRWFISSLVFSLAFNLIHSFIHILSIHPGEDLSQAHVSSAKGAEMKKTCALFPINSEMYSYSTKITAINIRPLQFTEYVHISYPTFTIFYVVGIIAKSILQLCR